MSNGMRRLAYAWRTTGALALMGQLACGGGSTEAVTPVGPAKPGSTAPGVVPQGMAGTQMTPAPGAPGTGTPAPGMMTPPPTAPGPKPAVLPFQALPIAVQAAKLKNLLTGLPLSDAELMAVTAAPTALGGLIDQWMAVPEFQAKMTEFFKQAFQQTQTDPNDYDDQLGFTTNPLNNQDKSRFLRSAEEMFARTAMAIVTEGRPFNEVASTERFMMNTPLLAMYAWMDSAPLNDVAKPVVADWWLQKKMGAGLTFVRDNVIDPATGMPVPYEESIRPGSPFFFKFHEPRPYMGVNSRCKEPQDAKGAQSLRYLINYIFGGRPGCGSTNGQFSDQDWADWRWVQVRKPKAAEERTTFFELAKLRRATELVLATPRVGFMTTMAFFANWPTNGSNAYRVTTNQALIVGLGKSFDDRGLTIPLTDSSDDSLHIQPATACFGCHQTLDPMRDLFRSSYSIPYFEQLDPMDKKIVGKFSVDDAPATMGSGIQVFGKAMASHPRFATAWVQKLCGFANSAPCAEDDPEFKRVADAFRAGGYKFKPMLKDLFSSPLVTFAATTKTATQEGVIISITRRETLCAALSNRLGIPDTCGLQLLPGVPAAGQGADAALRTRAHNLSSAVPGAAYARGDEHPLLPHDPNLFFHAATEHLCILMAARLVGVTPQSRYRVTMLNEAVADMVGTVMGLPPSDPRATPMADLLRQHHAEALKAGANATDALQSTFILACESPLSVSLGL